MMDEACRQSRAPLEPHPKFSGQAQDLPAYFEEVEEYGKAQGRSGDSSLMTVAIEGAPSLDGLLWGHLTASVPVGRQWDDFKALVTLQYPEIEPVEDDLKYFEEFYSLLEGARCRELSLVQALGKYLRVFRLLFLAMVRGNILEMSHQPQLFLRGLPPQVELEVSRRLASRYPLLQSGRLWPIEIIVRVTKEVIEDGVGCSPPHLASKNPSSSLDSLQGPSRHPHSPSSSHQSSAPVECSRSHSRRHSQGSSSSKIPSHSPFEVVPRTSKNPPRSPELASSSSSPLRATNAGSRHPAPPGWSASCEQASDSPSNSLRSSREDQPSHSYTVGGLQPSKVCSPRLETASSKPRDLGSTSTRPLRPREPSSTPAKLYSCFEASSTSFGKAYPRLESPPSIPSKPPSDCEPPHTTSFLLRVKFGPHSEGSQGRKGPERVLEGRPTSGIQSPTLVRLVGTETEAFRRRPTDSD
ncbi:hypothetical protein EDD15DRAFT_2428660 [Pisolithus albus]|nr:hypothetical protein EDD15DRAFT_2428660 [Pisolithus albus]